MTSNTASADSTQLNNNAYDYSFHTLRGHEPLPLSVFRGKVLIVVNTASKCGFTPQYARLEKLYEKYKDRGLVILGVPANDFGGQEPGTEQEIANFCQVNYGVTFPMAAKEVVSGKNAHPFYLWAKEKLGFGTAPKWNFHKYLINRKGDLVDYFYSTTSPEAGRFVKAVEKALAEEA
ncbi:glutathione peroxidase [Fluoribacter dumoffii]|uniref:glutathione peroxidase n=1 Tax=Fluoribacter dumoffii TaxID=463 RepID=UPI002244F47A|nr:glutathione peroxidase [Fluoribacter dumoffii]MCW8387747.1 glutathione peroxidase [Fluoribacter dumoffii]MCW8497950.1 glutathione peroxidase [Fluoribacter dumoffii]